MARGSLVVPSDITLLEQRYAIGKRQLLLQERLGLMGIVPVIHFRYAKNDKNDYRATLEHQLGIPETMDKSDAKHSDILDILQRRQKSISRRVISQQYMWSTIATSTIATWFAIRHYDYKTKAIFLPFVAYGASFIGRWFGDLCTGRWSEYGRDRFLGSLPAKQIFTHLEAPTAITVLPTSPKAG